MWKELEKTWIIVRGASPPAAPLHVKMNKIKALYISCRLFFFSFPHSSRENLNFSKKNYNFYQKLQRTVKLSLFFFFLFFSSFFLFLFFFLLFSPICMKNMKRNSSFGTDNNSGKIQCCWKWVLSCVVVTVCCFVSLLFVKSRN